MAKNELHFKLFVLGDSTVGKTCLLLRYTEDKFTETHLLTLGIDYRNKNLTKNNKKVKLQLWDTAGQERYRIIAKQMYKNAHGILLLYDITKRETFENIAVWMKQINENIGSDILKVLVGNKCDLEDQREVSEKEGKDAAAEYNIHFFEVSALSNKNVVEVFNYLTEELIKDPKLGTPSNGAKIVNLKKKQSYC